MQVSMTILQIYSNPAQDIINFLRFIIVDTMMAEVHQPSNELSSPNEEVEEDIANNNDPNNNAPNLDVDEVLRVEEDICDILEGTIDDETSNILKLFPGAEREDIRQRLENNWTNPLRQQVRMIEVLRFE